MKEHYFKIGKTKFHYWGEKAWKMKGRDILICVLSLGASFLVVGLIELFVGFLPKWLGILFFTIFYWIFVFKFYDFFNKYENKSKVSERSSHSRR